MTMGQICKWTVAVDGIDYPIGGGNVIHVDCQFGPGSVQVWTMEPRDVQSRTVTRACVYGTGQYVDDGDEHCGSVTTADGRLIWHVFRKPVQ